MVKLVELHQTYGLMRKLLLKGADLCYVLSCDFFSSGSIFLLAESLY